MTISLADLLPLLSRSGVSREVVDAINPSLPLSRQGVDSIAHPLFILAVEDRFGVRVDEERALSLRTLDDFLAFLAAHVKA